MGMGRPEVGGRHTSTPPLLGPLRGSLWPSEDPDSGPWWHCCLGHPSHLLPALRWLPSPVCPWALTV